MANGDEQLSEIMEKNFELMKNLSNMFHGLRRPRNGKFFQMGIIVDSDNMYSNIKTCYGVETRINWDAFLKILTFPDFKIEGRAHYYESIDEGVSDKKRGYFTFLGKVGWRVILSEKTPVYNRGEVVSKKGGSDVLFAIHAIEWLLEENIDLLVLVTGDRDFVPLVEKYKNRGALVALVHTPQSTSQVLKDVSNFTWNIDDFMKIIDITKNRF